MSNSPDRLFTARDCEKAFPWISAWTTNHRVKNEALPISHPSPGSGIPNMLTLPELVHSAVLDELASLGVFALQNASSVQYQEPTRDKNGNYAVKTWGASGTNPYFVDYGFYTRHSYHVIIEVQLRHDMLPGRNIPRKHREGPGRFYYVNYSPEIFDDGELYPRFMRERLDYWLKPEKKKFNRLIASKAYVRVRPLYELAVEVLGLNE